MSVKIESAGLFSEAAYGPEGVPGAGGVTGGGESHDVAWKQALVAAKASLTTEAKMAAAAASDPSGAGLIEQSAAALGAPAVKHEHPLSWDRLSMTVASMVAWNMSVGLADDVSSDPIELESAVDGGVNSDLPGPSGEFDSLGLDIKSDGVSAVAEHSGVEGVAAEPQTAPDSLSAALSDSDDTNIESGDVNNALFVDDSAESIVQTNVNDFREGTEVSYGQDGMQSETTGLREVGSYDPMDAQQGTLSDTASPSIMMAMGEALVSEIPSSSNVSTGGIPVRTSVVEPAVQVGPGPSQGARQDSSLESIVAVRGSSVIDAQVDNGRERLESIRSVLLELEDQASMRNTVADFLRADRVRARQASSLSTTAGAVGPIASDAVSRQATAMDGKATLQSNDQLAQVLDGDTADDRTFGSTDPKSSPRPGPVAQRQVSELATRSSKPLRSNPEHLTNSTAPNSTQLDAAFVGTENAEISDDQLATIESYQVDAETIEASEVPELAVQDVSHLDVDIDDPMGTVRLAMSRDAEEVSIRMETPAEALENYRQMEAEMAEAVEKQGLELGEFSAEAHDSDDESGAAGGDGSDDASNTARDQDVDSGSGLRESGTVSRLVNRIV